MERTQRDGEGENKEAESCDRFDDLEPLTPPALLVGELCGISTDRYTAGMASTTIKLSVETRERLRAFGGETYEHTVIEALDALEANRFWSEADAAAAWQSQRSKSEQQHRHDAISKIDRAFDGIE